MAKRTTSAKTQEDMESLSAQFMATLESNAKTLRKMLGSPIKTTTALLDPLNVAGSFARGTQQLVSDPLKLLRANIELAKDHIALLQYATQAVLGHAPDPVAKPDRGDRRFSGSEWDNSPAFDLIRQSYLLTSRWLLETMSTIEGLDELDAHKVRFYTEQVANSMSPSNFLFSNPEVIRATLDSGGRNLLRGLKNLQRDIKAGGGQLKMTMAEKSAFTLGENVASTPGKIVFQNDLVQLIQYEPTTEQVYRRPLLVFPPWINKYYILDLQPKNSFIAWAVAQGYTVFVVSWVNPDERLAAKTMDDYLREGILESIDAVEQATGESEMTAIGYCIGGTLFGAALAYMAAKNDDRIKATTFFAAQVDFSEAGDLKVFIDETQLERLDERMAEKGYLDGGAMYTTFNMLRSNDLIWSFWVNNYLLGKDPLEFDLLYWNGDTTRMPRALHMFYLREMYLKNNLAKPNGIELDGVPIDLGKVETPIYLQASREDHIAPYPSVFKAKNLFSGPVRFMLAGSGHIAGVINPPVAEKYNYWMNEDQPNDLDEWVAGAESRPGSWWPDWDNWLQQYSGERVPARTPGDGKLKVIEDAPGSYASG
ncbi:MAG: class I poly(R)-hydroxyalkanoic acid synthase [Pseudomonadota bacterium]